MKPVALVRRGNNADVTALSAAGYQVVLCNEIDAVQLTDRTLRDEFAMAALAAIGAMRTGDSLNIEDDPAIFSKVAYALADAMLEERGRALGEAAS